MPNVGNIVLIVVELGDPSLTRTSASLSLEL